MKTTKFLLTLILTIILIFNINITFATEEEFEDITEIETETTSEEGIEPLSETTDDETDVTEELPTTDFLSTPDSITNVSTVNSISQMNLQLNNILCIILISIGVLLILFAIAILIRLKQ